MRALQSTTTWLQSGLIYFFHSHHCFSGGNQASLPGPLWKPSRKEATRSRWAARWTRTRNGSRSLNLEPNSIGSESLPASGFKAELTTNSQYSSFRYWENSPNPERLQKAWQHSARYGALPLSLRQLSDLGLDFRRGKASFTLRPTATSLLNDRRRKSNLSVSQWLSRSGIPKPPLQRRWLQTCL